MQSRLKASLAKRSAFGGLRFATCDSKRFRHSLGSVVASYSAENVGSTAKHSGKTSGPHRTDRPRGSDSTTHFGRYSQPADCQTLSLPQAEEHRGRSGCGEFWPTKIRQLLANSKYRHFG